MNENDKNLGGKVVTGISWKLAERILNQGISFIVTIILARLLTPNDYGVVAMVNVFIVIADIIISSGFTSALIQKKNATERDYSTIFYLNLMISFGLYLLLFFCAPLIAKLYKTKELIWILRIVSLKLPLSALYSIQTAHVSRNMNFKVFFFSTTFASVISAIVGIVMAKFGFGVWALVAQQLVCTFVSSFILCFTIRWRPKLIFSKQSIKETRSFGIRIMATDVIGSLFNQLNSFIIGVFYTTEDLAYYSKGQSLPNMATNIVSMSFNSVLFPALSSINDSKTETKKLLRSSTKMFSFIVFPILMGIFIVASDLIDVLYTSKWSDTTIFLQIMCINGLISILGEFDIITLKSLGKSKLILVMEIIKKPIFFIITIIAIKFGVVWIAFSTIIINLLALIINTYALNKEIKYSFFEKSIDCLNSLILAIFMIVAVYLVGFISINSLFVRFFIKVIVGIVVYFLLAYITKNKEFITIINYIKQKYNKNKINDNTKLEEKNMKCLFICNTIYQIIVASSIVSQQKCNADLIISDHSNSIKNVVSKIKQTNKYFDKCSYFETKEFCFGNLEKEKLKNKLLIELQENNYLSKYDKLFIANWEGFTCLVYSNLKKINKKLELSWFEDGFGTYSFDGQFFLKPNLKTRIINRIKGNYSLYNEVKSLNLFNPKLLVWKINKPLEINTIKSPNDECKKFLNEIFEYNNLKDTYKEKFIFFQDGYKDFEDTTDIEMLEIIAKEVGKENIFIKRHPRDTSNKFKNKGFKTNIDTKIPSELIILNNDFSNSIFITFYSQSIITSSQLFGKKIKSIILSNINNKNNNDEYYKYLYEYIYKKDNKNYILPKTKEELINILRSI